MPDHSIVCTLFEGNYHHGLAALVNSLYKAGFNGIVQAGFRGSLPPWAARAEKKADGIWEFTIVPDELSIRFIQLDIQRHFTLYKPDFMLDLLQKGDAEVEAIFYFDPDIVLKCEWSFFERWIKQGVALCEDVNSPMSRTHPIRGEWAQYFAKYNLKLDPQNSQYVNGGFVGITTKQSNFLAEWKYIQELMMEEKADFSKIGVQSPTYIFHKSDQDALNITKDSTGLTLAIADKNAMDFTPGGYIMSHSVGGGKPWSKNFLYDVLAKGLKPSLTDKLYFDHAQYPIRIYNKPTFFFKKSQFYLAKVLGRVFS